MSHNFKLNARVVLNSTFHLAITQHFNIHPEKVSQM